MKLTKRSLRGPVALAALTGLGVGLRWMTNGSVEAATTGDLASMASLAIGAVGWAAYGWLLIAVLATMLEQVPGAVGRSASVVSGWVTSQSSRMLLRSALGVAAVTPLTMGAAHAAPGDSGPQHSIQSTWTALEKASRIQFGGEHFDRRRGMEPPSVQPSRETPEQWRAVEKASAVRFTDQPQPLTVVPERQDAAQDQAPEGVVPDQARQGAVPDQDRQGAVPDQGRPGAVPERRRQDVVPERRIAVPDRPTDGAPTRYTQLRSGREVRPTKPKKPPHSVIVRRGDSLWALAGAELGSLATEATIAARWPQWYAANSGAIGADPNLLLPGQVLRIPDHAGHHVPPNPVPPNHQEK